MGNEVQVQKTTGGLTFKVPPRLLAKIQAKGGNISAGVIGNHLLIKDKVWAASVGGEVKPFTRPVIIQLPDGTYGPDPSGAREPVQILNVIVVDHGQRGSIYYAGDYADGAGRAPDCLSDDGRRPAANVAEPQCVSCDACPKSQKGSKPIASNPNATACRPYKKLAVQVCSQRGVEWGVPPLGLKLAITSIWDENDDQSMAEGWYAWDNYVKFLAANQCTRTNAVITQMRFAPKGFKVQFKLLSFTEEADYDKTEAMADDESVKHLLLISRGETTKPQGKPLPKDEEPASPPTTPYPHQDVVDAAQKLRAAEEAEAARHAEAAAEAKAAADAKAEKKRKVDEAKAALAALEAEEGGFDDGPSKAEVAAGWEQHDKEQIARRASDQVAAGIAEEKKRTRRSKAEMEAVRAAEAAAKVEAQAQSSGTFAGTPAPTPTAAAVTIQPLAPPMETPTTTSLGGPAEIPAALAAALPAWD